MSTKHQDDKAVAIAALLGGHPRYFDYGHPERATSRKYWTIGLWTPEDHGPGGPTIHAFTRAECARKWLASQHPEVKL